VSAEIKLCLGQQLRILLQLFKKINLKNVCTETLDVKIAVQEKSMRWRTYNQLNMAPGDTISAYACEGTGKYMFWAKKTGDNTILFPSDQEIDIEFSKSK
jgi:D-lyxose ketol-isomerase